MKWIATRRSSAIATLSAAGLVALAVNAGPAVAGTFDINSHGTYVQNPPTHAQALSATAHGRQKKARAARDRSAR